MAEEGEREGEGKRGALLCLIVRLLAFFLLVHVFFVVVLARLRIGHIFVYLFL